MSRGRRYDDGCASAHAMDVLGDRWAFPVVRELMLGPRRFGDLRRSLPGLSANVLTQRLGELAEAGVVQRLRLPPPAGVQVYGLTDWGAEAGSVWGAEAGSVLDALGRWGLRSTRHDPTLHLTPVAFLLSLRATFDPVAAGGLAARLGFRFGGEDFSVNIDDGTVALRRGLPRDPDFVLAGEPSAAAALVYAGDAIAALEERGAVTVDGDRSLASRLGRYFPGPIGVGR